MDHIAIMPSPAIEPMKTRRRRCNGIASAATERTDRCEPREGRKFYGIIAKLHRRLEENIVIGGVLLFFPKIIGGQYAAPVRFDFGTCKNKKVSNVVSIGAECSFVRLPKFRREVQHPSARDFRALLSKHVEAEGTDVGRLEATGALNFLDLDDIAVLEEGEPVDPRSIISLPIVSGWPVLPVFERTPSDSFATAT